MVKWMAFEKKKKNFIHVEFLWQVMDELRIDNNSELTEKFYYR